MHNLRQDVHVTLSAPLLRAMERDRQIGHSHVMATLPHGLGDTPRESAQVLWHIDRAGERLVVRYGSVPAGAVNLGPIREVREVASEGRLQIKVAMNIQKTPPTRFPPELQEQLRAANVAAGRGRAFRSRLVVVPESERHDWVTRRLLNSAGFAAEHASLTISSVFRADLGRRRGGTIPYVEITANGTPINQEKFADALTKGIGKGKNFGLGLIQTVQLPPA